MIKTENTGNYIHTYSDIGMQIYGGVPEGYYSEAYDPIGSGRTYTEVEDPDQNATEENYRRALENLGVELNEDK